MTDAHTAPKIADAVEGDGVREVARQAASDVAADIEAEFAAAPAEHQFKLGVAFEAFRHARHALGDALRATKIAIADQLFALALHLQTGRASCREGVCQ